MKNISKSILTAAFLAVASVAMAQGQSKGQVLRGTVVDANGNPIKGAVVNVTESNRIAVTDSAGCFALKNVNIGDEVAVNGLGYTQKIEKANFSSFVVALDEEDPYEKQFAMPFTSKKVKYVTESTSSVSGEELEKHPVTILQNAFNSTLTGVETFTDYSDGFMTGPGWEDARIYIRGLRTTNPDASHPLIIVDNVERDLSFLDAYPIEKVTVLKDAAASAIYGMKGANGAIIVTTKRGEAGKTKISFTQEFGFQTSAGMPEAQNSYNYALTRNQARYLDGMTPEYSDYDIEQYRKVCNGEELTGMDKYKYYNTNWAKTVMRNTAPQMKTNLQISGGNDRVRYYVSFSYLNQQSLYNTDFTEWNDGYSTQHALDRFNLRTNVDINVNKFLSVNLDLGGRFDNISQPCASNAVGEWTASDPWRIFCQGIAENHPTNPIFNPDGSWYVPAGFTDKNGAMLLAGNGTETNRIRNLYTTMTLRGNLDFLTKGLTAHFTYSFDGKDTFKKWNEAEVNAYSWDYRKDYASVDDILANLKQERTFKGLSITYTTPRSYYINLNMNAGFEYARQFGKHDISAATFARTYQHTIRGQYSSYRYASFNFTGTYAYDNRYMFTANLSRMGSDNYERGNRWDTFYGFSAGWNMAQEKWMKDSFVKLLKLRASYGRAGYDVTLSGSSNEDNVIYRYPYQNEYAAGGGYGFGALSGNAQSNIIPMYNETATGTNNIKWEISKMLNLGIDWDLWHRKFYGSFDWFKEWRSDVLVSRSNIPTLFGGNIPLDSYGKIESHGVELTIGHENRIGSFKYYIEGMLSWNTNKLRDIDEVEREYDYQQRTGKRIGQGFMLKKVQWVSDQNLIATSQQDAIDHPEKYPYNTYAGGTEKLGNAVFYDANGDRQINDDDKIAIGYNTAYDQIPELTPSVKVGFEWKGFDARIIMTAYLNRTAICRENMDYGFGWNGSTTHAVVNTWGYYNDDPNDPRNINALYPRLSTGFPSADRMDSRESDIWLVNGDYLSLRNIEIGYSLPLKWISRIGMTKCRIYFSGYNLKNWSHLPDGFDPENPTNYVWSYPKTKSFSFGVNVAF